MGSYLSWSSAAPAEAGPLQLPLGFEDDLKASGSHTSQKRNIEPNKKKPTLEDLKKMGMDALARYTAVEEELAKAVSLNKDAIEAVEVAQNEFNAVSKTNPTTTLAKHRLRRAHTDLKTARLVEKHSEARLLRKERVVKNASVVYDNAVAAIATATEDI